MAQQWKLDPTHVISVISSVGKDADQLGSDFQRDDLAAVGKAVVAPNPTGGGTNAATGSVLDAVKRLFDHEAANRKAIIDHLGAGVVGVSNALLAYERAQRSMANGTASYQQANAMQAHMFTAAATGDMTWFNKFGLLPGEGGH